MQILWQFLTFCIYTFITTIAQSAITIPTAHRAVIFSLKNRAAINAESTMDDPDVNGYKNAVGTVFAARVLKYEYAKRHTAMMHITRNTFTDLPSLGLFSALFAITKAIRSTIAPKMYVYRLNTDALPSGNVYINHFCEKSASALQTPPDRRRVSR